MKILVLVHRILKILFDVNLKIYQYPPIKCDLKIMIIFLKLIYFILIISKITHGRSSTLECSL